MLSQREASRACMQFEPPEPHPKSNQMKHSIRNRMSYSTRSSSHMKLRTHDVQVKTDDITCDELPTRYSTCYSIYIVRLTYRDIVSRVRTTSYIISYVGYIRSRASTTSYVMTYDSIPLYQNYTMSYVRPTQTYDIVLQTDSAVRHSTSASLRIHMSPHCSSPRPAMQLPTLTRAFMEGSGGCKVGWY